MWEKVHDELRGYVRYRSGKKSPERYGHRLAKRANCSQAGFAAMMQERRLRDASGIYSWTRARLRGPQRFGSGPGRGQGSIEVP